MESAIVLIQCPDNKGIVAKISNFVYSLDSNIIQADQYSTGPDNGHFFLRIEFCFDPCKLPKEKLETGFEKISKELNGEWQIYYKSKRMRMGILTSKQGHCLFDVIYRWISGEMAVEIPIIISNHDDLQEHVQKSGLHFKYIPTNKENKRQQEQAVLELIKENTDFLVLARYMQILSPEFLEEYKKPIINIHHSFLPSFKGADPYRQAYERGVKIIGATAHYVTETLDEGPIIEQMVERVSHRDSVNTLKRKGRDLEKAALSSAIHAHIEQRIIRISNKTVIFH